MISITNKLEYSHAYEEYQRLCVDGELYRKSERGKELELMLIKYASEHMKEFIQVSDWMKYYLDEIPDSVSDNLIKVITFALPKDALDFTIKDTGRDPLEELSSYGFLPENECESYVYHWMDKEDFENLEGVS